MGMIDEPVAKKKAAYPNPLLVREAPSARL